MAAPRRTSAEVQQEREAKAQARIAKEEAKQCNIERAAAFEHADMANENDADITPRPRNRKNLAPRLSPLAEAAGDDTDMELSDPPPSTELAN